MRSRCLNPYLFQPRCDAVAVEAVSASRQLRDLHAVRELVVTYCARLARLRHGGHAFGSSSGCI